MKFNKEMLQVLLLGRNQVPRPACGPTDEKGLGKEESGNLSGHEVEHQPQSVLDTKKTNNNLGCMKQSIANWTREKSPPSHSALVSPLQEHCFTVPQ